MPNQPYYREYGTDQSALVTQPSDGFISRGFTVQQPSVNHFNWFFKNIYGWIGFLNNNLGGISFSHEHNVNRNLVHIPFDTPRGKDSIRVFKREEVSVGGVSSTSYSGDGNVNLTSGDRINADFDLTGSLSGFSSLRYSITNSTFLRRLTSRPVSRYFNGVTAVFEGFGSSVNIPVLDLTGSVVQSGANFPTSPQTSEEFDLISDLTGTEDSLFLAGIVPSALYKFNPSLDRITRIGSALNFGIGTTPRGMTSINGTIYAIGRNSSGVAQLFTINTDTGIASQVGATISSSANLIERDPQALAYHNGVLYMVGRGVDALLRVNTSTSALTRVGSADAFGVVETQMDGLASHNGVLYGVGRNSKCLYTIDETTGVATRVGNVDEFGVGEDIPTGLVSHKGILYMTGQTHGALYTLNTTTGRATRVSNEDNFGTSVFTFPIALASARDTNRAGRYRYDGNVWIRIGDIESSSNSSSINVSNIAIKQSSGNLVGLKLDLSDGSSAQAGNVFNRIVEANSGSIYLVLANSIQNFQDGQCLIYELSSSNIQSSGDNVIQSSISPDYSGTNQFNNFGFMGLIDSYTTQTLGSSSSSVSLSGSSGFSVSSYNYDGENNSVTLTLSGTVSANSFHTFRIQKDGSDLISLTSASATYSNNSFTWTGITSDPIQESGTHRFIFQSAGTGIQAYRFNRISSDNFELDTYENINYIRFLSGASLSNGDNLLIART